MLGQILESFFSKVGEKLGDYVFDTVRGETNFKFTLETLERNFRLLNAKASDVEEEIKNAELSGKKKRKREVENWLKEVQIIGTEFLTLESQVQSEGFIRQFFGGGRAEGLNTRVDGLIEQSRHFGELLLDVSRSRGEAFLTTRLVGEAFEKNLERIWNLLVVDRVPSIGIYGMGGVGKTTLAKHINNRLIEKTQECVYWVTVSQEFSIKWLQDEIARVVGIDFSNECNEDKRAARLNRAFSCLGKNFVLILDDVWKNFNLEKVGDPLRVEGCRLMITTRSLEVCRQIGCQEKIPVKILGKDEAWKLFSQTLGQETKLTPQVEEIAKSVAKVCDGLPLGIITLAGSMRGETGIRVWRNALAELKEHVTGQDDREDEIFKVLKYSFDRLDQREEKSNGYTMLQKCFLYCSLYPEDHKIGKDELVHKFITEELVDKRKNRREQFEQGYYMLDKLVKVCLLEIPYDYRLKMHDLVRDMALKITKGKYRVIAGHLSLKEMPNEEEWTKDLEKMSLMWNGIEEIPARMSPDCPNLSTLLLNMNPLEFIPDSFFLQMHGLCTLDLSRTSIKELPNSVSDLESLKVLLLRRCWKLASVPYLGKLKALMELDLLYTAIKEVPLGIENLVNLKCLNLPCHIEPPVEEIKRMMQLEEFSGQVKNMSDFNWFIRSIQSHKYIKYHMSVGIFPEGYCHFPGNNTEVVVRKCNLKKILFAQDVKGVTFDDCEVLSNCFFETLTILECGGIECIWANRELQSRCIPLLKNLETIWMCKLPDFRCIIKCEVGAVVASQPPPQAIFSSLRSLVISDCHKMTNLGLPLSELQNLEEITILRCNGIQEIIEVVDDSGRPEGEAVVIHLPKLRKLHLCCLPRLKSICKATMNCNSIEIIELRFCEALKKLPLFFPQPPPTFRRIIIWSLEWESLEWDHLSYKLLLQPFVQNPFPQPPPVSGALSASQ